MAVERAAADRLTVEHLDSARRQIAEWARARQFPQHLREEIVDDVSVILLELARSFDPARGPSFRQYMNARMRLRLIDRLRKQHGRTATMNAGNILRRDAITAPVSLDSMEGFDVPDADPQTQYQVREKVERIYRFGCQDERDRSICDLIMAGVPYREIGRRFGISESRVCQVAKEIGKRCRSYSG